VFHSVSAVFGLGACTFLPRDAADIAALPPQAGLSSTEASCDHFTGTHHFPRLQARVENRHASDRLH